MLFRTRLPLLAILLCCAVTWPAAAERLVLEVIELQHRLVRDIVPVVQPILAPGGTLTGTANRLIVRTTPENLAEVRQVVAALDTRLRQLRITVTQDVAAVVQTREDALAGQVQAGDFAAGIGAAGPPGALPDDGGAQASLHYSTARTRSRNDSANLHYVVGMEGAPAWIATGAEIPLPYAQSTVTPFGAGVASGIAYRQVSSGFYVTPRVQGDGTLVLEVAPELQRAAPDGSGLIASRGAATTVTGRLGEWIAIGGASIAEGGTDAELLARTRRQGDNSYAVWIRVEEQP